MLVKRKFENAKIDEDDDEIVIRIKKRKLTQKKPFVILHQNDDNEMYVQELNQDHKLFTNLIEAFNKGILDYEDHFLYNLISESYGDITDLYTIPASTKDDKLKKYAKALKVKDLNLMDFRGLVTQKNLNSEHCWMNLLDPNVRDILLDLNVLVMYS